MKIETIEKILNFLDANEGKEIPSKWFNSIIKFIEKLENHPDGIQYKHEGSLELYYENIKKLPNDLYVRGYINLGYCRQLTKLPDKLYVGEGLDLGGCAQLTKLPDNLYVGDYLGMFGTNIKKLPNDLYVGGDLGMIGTNITKLPNNLYIGGDLDIRDTPLANKYTNQEIRDIVASKGGTLIGKIIR